MKILNKVIFQFFALILTLPAAAQVSQLNIAGDLIVHPAQISALLTQSLDKMRATTDWNWSQLRFTRPYRTVWSQVQAKGPFEMKLSTENVSRQELAFEMTWNDPAMSAAQFQIDDTVTREVGGATVIVHIVGQCSDIRAEIPAGQWKAAGRLRWGWGASGIELEFSQFQLQTNTSAVPKLRIGDCQGPNVLSETLATALKGFVSDRATLENVLRENLLSWAQSSLAGLESELMKSRVLTLRPGLDLAWNPENLGGVGAGLLRVQGHFSLARAAAAASVQNIERTYKVSALEQATESSFVLPKDTVPTLINFIYSTGDLHYRVSSDKIPSFQSLMQNRFVQLLVWPDLLAFAQNTLFVFDVLATKAPELSPGYMLPAGGVGFDVQAPLRVAQWAPGLGKWLPYLDFMGGLMGRVEAQVQGNQLALKMQPSSLSVAPRFRSEFSVLRAINPWIAASVVSSRVRDYLSSHALRFPLPAWALPGGFEMGVRAVEQRTQSFRIPLEIRNSK